MADRNSNKDQRDSLIRDFNEKSPNAKFGDILTGQVRFSELSDEQKGNLASIFSRHPGKYDDFIRQANYAFEQRQNSVTNNTVSREAFLALRHIEQQKMNISNNLQQLQAFMDGYKEPVLSQKIGGNYGHLFTPFQSTANGVPMFSQAAQTQRLIAYYASARNQGGNRTAVDTSIVNEIMNSKMLRTFNDGEIRFQGGSIWSHLDSPAAVSAYNNFSVNAQDYLEKFAEFDRRLSNPKSPANAFIALDIETFGDNATGDWFHANEIAAQRVKFDRKTGTYIEDKLFSYVTKPTTGLANDMVATIEALKKNPLQFSRLSEARQRSLVDLMKYSTSSISLNGGTSINPAQFIKEGGNVNVIHSNATDLNELYSGKTLNQRVIMEGFNSYAEHMLSGLNNLQQNGEQANIVMERYNQLVGKYKSNFFITHNGDAFDLPGLEKFGQSVGVSVASPKNHLDWLKLEQSTFANPYVMHQVYGRNPGVGFEEGPWTIQEHRRTFGWDTKMGHIGTYDVGLKGTAGIVLETMGHIRNQISNGANSAAEKLGLRRKSTVLDYSQDPLRKGQTLFATNAVQNWAGKVQDFQAELVDGQLQMINPGFNRNVLDAESFYTSMGVRKLEGEKYALELLNETTGTYSYVVREGENARAQIAQFVQQHLEVADDMMDTGRVGIVDANLTDKARRRYESLLGLNQGYTRGFDGAKRIFDNVRIFNENVSGPDGPRSRAELEKLMNFNSLADGAFNASEAEQFWKMLPRLQSEHGAFTMAIGEIEKAMPMVDGLNGWQKRDLNMQRSLALRRFSNELDNATGGAPVETRPALPYERHILEFDDRVTGRSRTLNLKDTPSAYQGVLSYVYADNADYKDNPRMQSQVANERYLTLLTSLQESGVMSEGQMNMMVDDFLGMENASPAIHAKTLAMELSTNLEVLKMVERDSITSTSLAARKAVENLGTTEVMQMAKNATGFARNVYGQKVVNGNVVKPTLTAEMDQLFRQLDNVHGVTGLNPGHRQAIGGLLQRFMSAGPLSHGVGIAVTSSLDNNLAYLNIFDEVNSTSVLSALEGGEVHPNAVRVAIPLIGTNGTMRYNNMQINANSTVIMGENGLQKVSSVRKVTDSFNEGIVSGILRRVKDGNIDSAQWMANNTTKEAIDDLAGIKRNLGESDTYIFKNTIADVYKQGHVNVIPGMAHQLYGQPGGLEKKHFTDDAFDKNGNLKTYLDSSHLYPGGLENIDRQKMDWARTNQDVIGAEPDMSSVKSEHAAGTVGTVAAREATFAGIATPHGRDNSVQLANSYAFDARLQASFSEINDGTYYSFQDTTNTPLGRELEGRLTPGDKQSVKLRTALLSENELQSRLRNMRDTAEGFELLKSEKIINDAGEWNPARMPTVYEQQIVMNKEIIDRLWMEQTKFFDIGEEMAKIEEFMKQNNGTLFLEDGRYGVRYAEQAHKLFFDFEKGTVGGGGGFSLRFLEELTGIKGVGAIIGPDVAKHEDFSSLYRGHMNRIADHINGMSGEERANAIARVQGHFVNWETGQLGLTVVDKGDSISIDEHWRAAGITEIDNRAFVSMMSDIGLSQSEMSKYSQNPTASLIQDAYIAQVSDWSSTVGEDGGKVRYGPRELDMLKRQGMTATAEFIANTIDDMADSGGGITNKQTALGILDAGRAIDGRIAPEDGTKVWNASDFRPSPVTDSNRATYARTILDSDWLRGQNPSTATGVWVNLPKVSEELAFQMEGRTVDKVFLPYTQLQGKGNEVWKTDLQRINEGIIRSAQRLENTPMADANGMPNDRGINNARQALQNQLDELTKQVRHDISSSDGFIVKNVLKGQLPSSASGLTKIIPPSLTQELGGAFTYISEVDAEKLGVADILRSGQEYYVPDLRYPSFHEKALRITQLRMSEHLPEGHQLISADIADDLRADSDGDMNHIISVQDEKVQDDMRRAYARQQRERAILGSVTGGDQTYNLEEMGNIESRPGISQLYDPRNANVAYDEFAAKFGKQLVGMASNLNYQYSHLAMQYGKAAFGENEREMTRAMFDFLEGRKGIEQKIISAKHGMDGLIDSQMKNPALQLIEALQGRRWNEALQIDKNLLGSMFTNDANMERAIAAIQILESQVSEEQMKNVSRRFGLSSGVPDEVYVGGEKRLVTMGTILDIVDGNDADRLASNQTVAGLNNLAGADAAQAAESLQPVSPPPVDPAHPYVPSSGRVDTPVNTITPQYTDRGISKLGSVLDSAMHSKIGVGVTLAAGLGAGALMLSNLTSSESITPEGRPHNDELIQSSHGGGGMMGGGTARVEQNGTGLNGMRVSVSGTAPGHLSNGDIGNMANQALSSSGIQGNINVRSQDDTSSIDRQWLEQQFTQLINTGYAGGN